MGTFNYHNCDGYYSCYRHFIVDVIPHFFNSNYQVYPPPGDTPVYNEEPPDWGCKCEEESSGIVCKCDDISNGCTPAPTGNDSQIIGDPHFITFDGLAYDFQAAGEFIYIESTLDPVEMTVQVRQQPLGKSRHVSIITAVASSVDGDIIELYLHHNPNLYVNKMQVGSDVKKIELQNGGYLFIENNVYKIFWPDNSQISFKVYNQKIDIHASFTDERKYSIHGLSGNFDDDSSNDLTSRDRSIILDTKVGFTKDILYGDFTESWRINQNESLFNYFSPNENTETYTDRFFPVEIITAKDLSEDHYKQGETICENAGVIETIMLESCILDVVLSGDEEFVQGFQDAKSPKEAVIYEPVLPKIISTKPSENEKEIPLNTFITIKFNKPMDATSITKKTFFLNSGIDAAVNYDYDTMTAKLDPLENLDYNTNYTVIVTGEVKDVRGNAVLSSHTWNFTTIPEPNKDNPDSDDDGGSVCFIKTVTY